MHKFINLQFDLKTLLFLLLSNLVILLFVSCNQENTDKKEIILATVGNEKITVEDFRRNYEFGLPHLKSEPNRKLSYLNYMIYEKILSMEGYKLGFNNSERVKKSEHELLNELLVEELFIKNVNSKIDIKPDEVDKAILKSQVSWKMSYWFEKNKDQAYFIHKEMTKNGFKNTVSEVLRVNPEVKLQEKDFETDYITWLEIAPEILDKIKDLSINDISEPIELENGFFIFQIQDIKREPISDFSIKEKHERFRQILYYRKLKEAAGKYIGSVMTPKNVKTNGKTLYEVTSVFLDWKRDTLKQKFTDFITERNNDLLSKVLVSFDQEEWKVSDFLKNFNSQKISDKSLNVEKIGGEISNQIALQVRDYVLIKLAIDGNLGKSKSVQKQMKDWRDKWVYDEARRHYLKRIKISDDEASSYFEKNIKSFQINASEIPKYDDFKITAKKFAYIQQAENTLLDKIDSLKENYEVYINNAVLDTINTVDFEKSRWQSLQVFKRSSNRLAAPIVDPAWKIQ